MIIQVFICWIQNLIDIFRRIHYSLHGAIEITGVYNPDKSKGDAYCFDIEHDSQACQVHVISPQENLSTMGSKPVTLWWIPGKKGAMRAVYANDPKTRRALLIWDIVSAISFILLLGVFAMVYVVVAVQKPGESIPVSLITVTEFTFLAVIAAMIVASVMRKKLRR